MKLVRMEKRLNPVADVHNWFVKSHFLSFNTFVVLKAVDACKSLSSIATES